MVWSLLVFDPEMVQKAGGSLMKRVRTEFYKMRHTFLFPIHILIPVISAGIFLAWTRISAQLQFSAYVQAVGVAFPALSSLICAGSVELEIPGRFQGFMMVPGKKECALLAKWMSLEILAFLAVMSAMVFYGAGNRLILGDMKIPFSVFLKAGVLLWSGSIPLYLEHLFLNLRLSKAVSLAVSVGQTLVSALFLTGLGDGRWQYVPCSWSSRGTSLYLAEIFNRRAALGASVTGFQDIFTCVLLGVILCVIIFIWFHFYEGRQENE